MRRGSRRWAWAGALLAAGCAGGRPRAAAPPYTFPAAFEATQAVHVDQGAGGAHDLIASLRRRGPDYEVTLFDPVFAFPLLRAEQRGGVAREELLAPGVRPGDGRRLLELLAAVYGCAFEAEDGGPRCRVRLGVEARLAGGTAGGAGCDFPERLEVKAGGAATVEVRTLSVRCEAAPGR